MAKKDNKILVPKARENLYHLKGQVMKAKGYNVTDPHNAKYEIAKEEGIPLNKMYNGHLRSKEAGKIGGPIGGNMVKKMVKIAQEKITQK
ncbi:alpha/beta-type small acid-soluble spore protein [Virgibacillus alimentarius]|uniref:Alpha/beta hydrolase n=1 Tax=Virgibacillus alimentarius TaxID=698769 RepID=A0ABS4SAJ5_9BACI|nr:MULTISPECIES: alpha/beta-type small acid-soluble spore protein [Virgibacillus]MBP2258537.1 hypothetical protein [Virgibacillus alimentarius]HLR67467.1 alpha/beta-type small acid-soluble spore protein [Virgibacillus sp.]